MSVFFVLSGFLITTILLREHAATGRLSFRRFYQRRAVRLMPALVAAVVLAWLFLPVIPGQDGSLAPDAARALTYTNDLFGSDSHNSPLSVTWSLGVEEQFYLLWPALLLLLLRSRRRASMIAVGVGVVIALRALLAWHGVPPNAHLRPWNYIDLLGIGALLALSIHDHWLPEWAYRLPWVGVGVTAFVFVFASQDGGERGRFLYEGGFSALAVGVALVLANVYRFPTSTVSLGLASRPLAWVGLRSYAIYLYQAPVILLFDRLRAAWPIQLILAVSVTFLFAALSWRCLERPMQRWLSKRVHHEVVPTKTSQPIVVGG